MIVWKNLCYNGIEYPKYQISSDGDIRNAKGLVLKKRNDKDGYLNIHIKLEKGGTQNSIVRLGRAVLCTFRPQTDMSLQANHIDGDKHNNSLENLEWVTQKENIRHSLKTGLKDINTTRAMGLSNRKYSEEAVRMMRTIYKSGGVTLRKLADMLEVPMMTLYFIISNRTYKELV